MLKTTFGLSSKFKKEQQDASPGPGHYESKTQVGELPKYELQQ